jgi:hypothetical protein
MVGRKHSKYQNANREPCAICGTLFEQASQREQHITDSMSVRES